MRERLSFDCQTCGEKTDTLRIVHLKYLELQLCPACHDHIKKHYSELEVVR